MGNAGLKVYTTLDYELQKQRKRSVARSGEENEKNTAPTTPRLRSTPSTGQLLTMVGSRDFFAP